jgi:hypothetical protein
MPAPLAAAPVPAVIVDMSAFISNCVSQPATSNRQHPT